VVNVVSKEYLLTSEGVSKAFGGIKALQNVNIFIEQGKITSLIGPNGAGKTTLFNLLTGTIPVDSGKIVFKGIDITNLKSYEVCKMGIVRTYQQKTLFPNLTVYENVEAGTMKDKMDEGKRKEKVYKILEFLDLEEKANIIVSSLPPLEGKFVELARSLATNPDLILLDEFIGGLITSEIEKKCTIVKSFCYEGHTIFQIGHEMKPIIKTSDWIFVLDKGTKIAEGTPEEIKKNGLVQKVYLETGGEEN